MGVRGRKRGILGFGAEGNKLRIWIAGKDTPSIHRLSF